MVGGFACGFAGYCLLVYGFGFCVVGVRGLLIVERCWLWGLVVFKVLWFSALRLWCCLFVWIYRCCIVDCYFGLVLLFRFVVCFSLVWLGAARLFCFLFAAVGLFVCSGNCNLVVR